MVEDKDRVVERKSCPQCGSTDNVAVYADGHEHCYTIKCDHHKFADGEVHTATPVKTRIEMSGQYAAIKDRKISKETCVKYGVLVDYAPSGEIANHYYSYFNTKTGELTATKKRICADKDFRWSGDRTDMGLFGQNACSGRGKFLTITEGECDALAVAEMFDRRWDVVSIPDGCSSARRALQGQLEWLEGYDSIVLCFDNDPAGKEAVEDVRDLFSPGKLKIAGLPLNDAGAMLTQGKVKNFVSCWWDAKSYQPDGVVMVNETWEEVLKYRDTPSVPYPWDGVNNYLLGQRTKEVVVWAADSGVGKSQAMREIQEHLLEVTADRIGCLMLEESLAKTTLGWMSFSAGRPLHKELQKLSDEELRKHWEAVTRDNRLVLLDHGGWNNNFETLKARIRYMAKALDCKWIVLDHLHYCLSSVSGATGDWSGIDELVTQLVSLALECDICIHLVCHISEDRSLRGSKGIKKLADAVVFLERDPHHEDPVIANTTTVVVDKNRWAGDLGVACYLYYDPQTGRMTECPKPMEVVDEF